MKKKIMIVDDEKGVIFTVKVGLDDLNAGYDIIGVNSGEECFHTLKRGEIPDLILLDIMMPEMDGWDVFDKLKDSSSWRDIPVVFLTARVDDVAKNAGKFLAVDYIEKPFEIGDLKRRIDKVLEK